MEAVATQNMNTTTQTNDAQENTQQTRSNDTQQNQGMSIKEDYSEKSFAVYGDTKSHKETLKALGGRFNKYLTIDGVKQAGWIFSRQGNTQEQVVEFVLKANSGETTFPTSTNSPGDLPTVQKPNNLVKFQYVKYKVYKPSENQKVQLKVDGTTKNGTVLKTETHNDVVDTLYLDFDGQTTLAKICNGKWEIFGYNVSHSLYFS